MRRRQMKKLALVFPLLLILACEKAPLTTKETPTATQEVIFN
jgi:hypothetical protein